MRATILLLSLSDSLYFCDYNEKSKFQMNCSYSVQLYFNMFTSSFGNGQTKSNEKFLEIKLKASGTAPLGFSFFRYSHKNIRKPISTASNGNQTRQVVDHGLKVNNIRETIVAPQKFM